MSHAFSTCTQSHDQWSAEFGLFYDIHSLVSGTIATAPSEKKAAFSEQLEEMTSTLWDYVGHLLRTKHQGDYYR